MTSNVRMTQIDPEPTPDPAAGTIGCVSAALPRHEAVRQPSAIRRDGYRCGGQLDRGDPGSAGPGERLTARVNPGVEAGYQPGVPPVGRRCGWVPGGTVTA
jgi:hypothetical protein